MASRLFWIFLAGAALITGMVVQDGGDVFGLSHGISFSPDRAIEAHVNRAIDHSVTVVGSDGHKIDAAPEMKRAMAHAVGRLLKAEARIAKLRITDGARSEVVSAEADRDRARAEVDRLKAAIKSQDELSGAGRHATRDRIRSEIREEVRDSIRETVQN